MDDSTIVDSTDVESTIRAFAALADPTRFSALTLLAAGPRCVCDLQEELGVAPNLLSYHLRVLREAGLVTVTRRGRWADYQFSPGTVTDLGDLLGALAEGRGR